MTPDLSGRSLGETRTGKWGKHAPSCPLAPGRHSYHADVGLADHRIFFKRPRDADFYVKPHNFSISNSFQNILPLRRANKNVWVLFALLVKTLQPMNKFSPKTPSSSIFQNSYILLSSISEEVSNFPIKIHQTPAAAKSVKAKDSITHSHWKTWNILTLENWETIQSVFKSFNNHDGSRLTCAAPLIKGPAKSDAEHY